ncbi:Gfo/Idh/MocA family protein [Paenibacillus rigui]|uniref:Oxidoreductase n=1 Tax=Paenibacillus rigui TaxID=554312 RepID=A0A229UKA7_9BACL|nr:Gfo/Idh/MocA family oxidoreductase [Paenibacillus rigui]OXM83734.1 oxidoreductase [Paenibacillus rigui]
MKALLAGLGVAGFSWYKRLKQFGGLEIAVVEPDASMKSKMEGDPYPFYTSLAEALEKEQPDFVVNVTPPHVHTAVNGLAFDRRIPVLCEKPISFDYEESIRIVERAAREGIPFMIAENYRRFAYVRKLKELLEVGTIGRITTVDITFYRYHHTQRKYTVSLLDDIAVHHWDMVRYLTGKEAARVFARNFNPIGSWSAEPADINLYAWLEMEDGIAVSYTGSITSRGKQTEWGGNWRIEGTGGAIEVAGKSLLVYSKEGALIRTVDDFGDVPPSDTLAEFIVCLRDGGDNETSAKDYLKTQAIVHYANESSRLKAVVDLKLHDIS